MVVVVAKMMMNKVVDVQTTRLLMSVRNMWSAMNGNQHRTQLVYGLQRGQGMSEWDSSAGPSYMTRMMMNMKRNVGTCAAYHRHAGAEQHHAGFRRAHLLRAAQPPTACIAPLQAPTRQMDGRTQRRSISAEAKYRAYRKRRRAEEAAAKTAAATAGNQHDERRKTLPAPGGSLWHRRVCERDRFKGTALVYRHIDASGLVVGRLAAVLSNILIGKHRPTYDPSKEDGDVVVVTNASRVEFTGRKWADKLYRHHTGRPGGLKEETARHLWERRPTEVLRRAVMGMLPKNALRRARMRKLRLYEAEDHDFDNVTLVPVTMPTLWKDKPKNVRAREAAERAAPTTMSRDEVKEKFGISLPRSVFYPLSEREEEM